MPKLNFLDWLAMILVIVGGLNWGLVGLFHFNLVEAIFGMGGFARFIYILVGLAGLYMIPVAIKIGKGAAPSEVPKPPEAPKPPQQ